ncbi:MAG TPA: hypothetical protein VHC90_15880 [Bryobacteraceae bacterium]|nr:hypothetical protein [Bryobacteraceae bacterium]
MKFALILAAAVISWAQTPKPAVPLMTIRDIEKATDTRLGTPPSDPWNVLGDARGTYLPGYGTVVTFELTLANLTPVSPFHPTVTAQEKRSGHDRKMKNLVALKAAMHEMVAHAATALTAMPGNEQITFEAFLFNFDWEDRTGLPDRLTISANREKIADAVAHHASAKEMASLFEERSE